MNFSFQACLMPNLPEEMQHQIRSISNYVVTPLDSVLAIMAFVCNTFTCFTVARTKSLQHPSLLMLCSLSISDLIWALFALAANVSIFLDPHMCPVREYAEQSPIGMLCFLATLSNLAVISRDRYQAICRPAWYRHHANRSRAIKSIALSWLASVATALSMYIVLKVRHSEIHVLLMVIFLFYVVCTLMILLNYFRFFIANKRRCRNLQIQVRSRRAEREKKMTRVITAIVLCFLFSFLPALLSPFVLYGMGISRVNAFLPFIRLLMTLNGFLNPLINYSRNGDMRLAMRNVLKCERRTKPLTVGNSSIPARNSLSTAQSGNIPLQELHF